MNDRRLNHGEEVHGILLETSGHATALLEPADALLDDAAHAIGRLVEAHAAVVRALVRATRDDRPDRMVAQPLTDARVTVALVSGHRSGPGAWPSQRLGDADPVQDRFELRRLVDLPGRDVDREGKAVAVSDQVELAPESAARAPQCVVVGLERAPFFPAPAADFEARTELPSTHQRSQSMYPSASSRICRTSRMRSNTPARRQELKW